MYLFILKTVRRVHFSGNHASRLFVCLFVQSEVMRNLKGYKFSFCIIVFLSVRARK